jgi:hypothetical protein
MDRIPGEDLANSVLQADLLNVLQLFVVIFAVTVVILFVVVGIIVYFNYRSLLKMTETQKSMSDANTQWAASDSKKTDALNRSVDEQTLLRQDFATSTYSMQKSVEGVGKAVEEHDAKVDDRVKSIIEHVTQASMGHTEAMESGLNKAVNQINEATIEAVKPALEVIDSLKRLNDTISTRHEATMELLRKQHEDQLKFMEDQNKAHTEVINNELTRAQQQIVDVLNRSTEVPTNENPIQPNQPLPPFMVPDPVSVLADAVPAVDPSAADTRPER